MNLGSSMIRYAFQKMTANNEKEEVPKEGAIGAS